MEDQESRADMFEKFTWKVENFSRLNTVKLYSEPFVLSGYPWRILLYPRGYNQVDYLQIYLEAVQSANMSKGWRRDVKFKFVLFNQFDSKRTITKEFNSETEFSEKQKGWGISSFMPLAELNDPQKGFLVKDVCIVGVEVSLCKAKNEKQVGQSGHTEEVKVPSPEAEAQGPNLETMSPVCIEPTKHTDVELFSASIGELMDFRGLGQIEKAFIPLLEEVCSQHPSLIECQQKRSPKYTGWAFNALGRVLYFLKTKKVKYMNELACKDLQTLWEELETFRFDLAWLEPHVQSALGMISCAEKVMQVEKLTDNVVALELEIERLKAKLVIAKVNLQVNLDAKRDLLKAKNFDESDLDAELGYGS